MKTPRVDICIVGGGMVGGTLAWTLGNAGYSVCMLEAQGYSSRTVPELIDERSVALSHGSKVLLKQLGLWHGIRDSATLIAHIHVGERGRLGATRLHAAEEGVDALGFTVRNSAFLKNLYSQLEQCENVSMLSPASVVSIAQQADRVEYEFERDSVMGEGSASLLLAADGSNSAVRQMVSISQTEKPYEQAAVIANVACELDHANTAWERFTDSGPLAMLPLGPKLMAMVYTVELADLESVLAFSDEHMLEALQTRFGYRLGRFDKIGKRLGFPLTLLESDRQYRGRVLMMGNSARTLHPVSGQGFNLALRDIALLAETLSVDGKLADPGNEHLLRQFCTQRKADQRSVVRFTDSMVRLFRGRAPGFSHLRACGLMALDVLPLARHLLSRQSMGMATRLPNLNALQSKIRENASLRNIAS